MRGYLGMYSDDVEWSSTRGRPNTRYDMEQAHQAVKFE